MIPLPEDNQQRSPWRIGEILIQKKWLSWDSLADALSVQSPNGPRIGEILSERGTVNQTHVYQALAIQYRMPFVHLKGFVPSPDVLKLFPKQMVYQYSIFPLSLSDRMAIVAVSTPYVAHLESRLLPFLKGEHLSFVMTAPGELSRAMAQYFGPNSIAA